jgi:membrane protease YdiL (CAAX protease family)
VGCSLLVVLLSWLLYVLVMSVFGLVDLRQDARALASMPLWKIAAQIVSTWFFVGMAEEVLFRGFFLKKFLSWFEVRRSGHALLWAVITSSAFFSLWHLPVAPFFTGQRGPFAGVAVAQPGGAICPGRGFAWLYLRSGSVLLVGLVHGLIGLSAFGRQRATRLHHPARGNRARGGVALDEKEGEALRRRIYRCSLTELPMR